MQNCLNNSQFHCCAPLPSAVHFLNSMSEAHSIKEDLEQQDAAAEQVAQPQQQSAVAEQPQPQLPKADAAEEQQQPSSSPTEEAHDEHQCHICMSSMKEPTAVKGCGHRFCRCCIEQWVGTRQQPACPVCRADVAFLIMEDGSEQVGVVVQCCATWVHAAH